MPPRYAYWTIIAGGLPTAFRAADRDELLPTFNRIQGKHPDAELKYFARGRLWTSPEEARLAAEARRKSAARGEARFKGATARGRDWRPGGNHRDPRQKFKDAKKAQNLERRRRRFERREQGAQPKDGPRPDNPRETPRRPGQPAGGARRFGRKRGGPGRNDRRRS